MYYTVKQIYPWLYSIYDPQKTYCYLIVGEKSALLYDTVYGIASIDEAVREVCNLPYEVVLGHGHLDHSNGAYQFPEVWIHPNDHVLCLRHTSKTCRKGIVADIKNDEKLSPPNFDAEKYIHQGAGNLKMLQDGQSFDLGGLTVKVIPMEGHTSGSVGLLIEEHKVLLNSDAANAHIWMFLDESLTIKEYITMLKRVNEVNFNVFFTGHSDAPRPKSDFDKFIQVAENITLDKSKPYSQMPELNGHLYEEDGVAIVFRPNKVV